MDPACELTLFGLGWRYFALSSVSLNGKRSTRATQKMKNNLSPSFKGALDSMGSVLWSFPCGHNPFFAFISAFLAFSFPVLAQDPASV
ncbi:MAG: hypothetical protein LBO66_02900 [Deltaproteobacteria bacterium]|jgi:hypothetical protein|nr:hypothetical protein [Deltaproteobacteria bacterium]